VRRLLGGLTLAGLVAGLVMAFGVAPREATQGNVQRIMYLHVPSVWVAYLAFGVVLVASVVYLVRRAEAADRLAHASAEVGVLFCTMGLISGPLWARPIWGVWFTWDPRLTMTVILWGIYASYIMLRAFGGEDEAVRRWAAVLGIIGILDIPIIRVSVRLLRGIHPAVITQKEGGSGLADPWMKVGLWVTAAAVVLLASWLIRLRMQSARLTEEVGALRQQALARGGVA